METKIIFIISLILAILFIVWINKPNKEKEIYVNNEKNLNYEYKLNIYLLSGENIETVFYSNHYYISVIELIEHCPIVSIFEKSKLKILKICLCGEETVYIPVDKIIKLHVYTIKKDSL